MQYLIENNTMTNQPLSEETLLLYAKLIYECNGPEADRWLAKPDNREEALWNVSMLVESANKGGIVFNAIT